MIDLDVIAFLDENQLPLNYCNNIEQWFYPAIEQIVQQHNTAKKPLIIGINGAQGSGKSTLAELIVFLLTHHFQLNAVSLSLDDFYLTHQQRNQLSSTIHPLMATRGVPGTHDIPLALKTIESLLDHDVTTRIPRFNKATDDRHDEQYWDTIAKPVNIIVLEGWCLGAEPQANEALKLAVNDLERLEDPDAHWRQYVNQQLSEFYPKLFDLIDIWIMLKAPSFDCVFNWRLEQEQKLQSAMVSAQKTMSATAVNRFIKFYQRITEHVLITLPDKVDFLFELDEHRHIIRSKSSLG